MSHFHSSTAATSPSAPLYHRLVLYIFSFLSTNLGFHPIFFPSYSYHSLFRCIVITLSPHTKHCPFLFLPFRFLLLFSPSLLSSISASLVFRLGNETYESLRAKWIPRTASREPASGSGCRLKKENEGKKSKRSKYFQDCGREGMSRINRD